MTGAFLHSRFRARLFLLVVGMVALFMGAVLWTGWETYRHSRDQVGRFHLQLARAISSAADRELQAGLAMLSTLAASPLLVQGRFAELHAVARLITQSHPGTSIALFSDSGERLLSTQVEYGKVLPDVPVSAPPPAANDNIPRSAADGVRQALTTRKASISGLYLNLVSGQLSVAIHLPVETPRRAYVVSLTMSPEVFQKLLVEQELPQAATGSLSDARGLTIARARSPGDYLGQPISEDLRQAVARATEGFAEGRTREGTEVVFAHSRSSLSGWTAAVGLTRPAAFGAMWAATRQLILVATLLLIAGIALALWIARSVARPLDVLTTAAEAMENGTPVALPSMKGDFGPLAAALGSADKAIREREQERALRLREEVGRQEAEALGKAKDRFLALLSHELRNPLAVIANCVELLKKGPQDAGELVRILARQTSQLRVLVDDVLDLARVTHGKLRLKLGPVDLAEHARAAASSAGAGGRIIEVDAPQAVWVRGDSDRLGQMVGNLVENAIRYGAGRIRIEARSVDGYGELTVEDEGPGIPPELLSDLFKPFVQGPAAATRQGLGLGLALVSSLATAQGGGIVAKTPRSGHGARFEIRLPLTADRPLVHDTAIGDDAKLRVLVIDDENDLRETTARIFAVNGHDVCAAANGLEGLAKVMEFQPEVAFVDLHLSGMSGYEFARVARASPAGRNLTLVALTGYGEPEDQQQAREAGFDLHITKPPTPSSLRHALAYRRPAEAVPQPAYAGAADTNANSANPPA